MNPLKIFLASIIIYIFSYECIPSNIYVTIVPPIIQHLGFDIVVVWRSDSNCSQFLYYKNLVTNETGNMSATFDSHYDDDKQAYYIKKVIISNIAALQPKSEIKVGNDNEFSDTITLKIPSDKSSYKFLLTSHLSQSNNSFHTISRLAKRVIEEKEDNKIPIILDFGNNSIDNPSYYYKIRNMIQNAYYIHLKQNKSCCHFDSGYEVNYGVINLPGLTLAILDPSEDLMKQLNFISNPMFNFNKTLSMIFGGPEILIRKHKESKLIEDFLNETKADIYLSGNIELNYHIRDNLKNISFINIGISSDQQSKISDYENLEKIYINNQSRYHTGFNMIQSFGVIDKPPGLKAKFYLITTQEQVTEKSEIKSVYFVVDNSWTFEEITAIVVFIITLAFFSYFVYSWIMCTRSKPREYDRNERDESTSIQMESMSKRTDDDIESELKMQIK